MCDPDRTTFGAVDYSQWFDEWGSWDPYSTIMSEIDGDLDDLLTIFPLLFRENRRLKKIKFQHKRVDWEEHISMLEYTNEFEKRFRMSRSMFDDLVEELRVPLTVSFVQSMRSTSGNEPIYPEVIVAISLRILGPSDTFESCADNYGMSVPSVKRVFDLFLNAIDFNETCRAMRIELPQGEEKLRDLAQRWLDVSTCPQGLYWGHIGAIDGWFPRTEMPRGVSNQADYFSGHYVAYGLNIQAMCDPDLLFMYVAVAGPGKINDSRAFSRCTGLIEWFVTLPDWCFVSADNAYPPTRKMLVPHNATELLSEYHRTYNFYLSQLRIRIEMAFGRLTTKWRRLRTTLNFHSAKNAKIIRVCTKLHNYVIRKAKEIGNEDYNTVGVFDGDVVDPQQYGIDPLRGGGPNGNSDFGFLQTHPDVDEQDLFSTTDVDCSRRDSMVADLQSFSIRRPKYNVESNSYF